MSRIPPIPEEAIEERFLRASGPGGQNVKMVCRNNIGLTN
jgi:protein subunit release factor B